MLMADHDILERFQSIIGVGKIYKRGAPVKDTHRQQWTWQVTAADEVKSVIEKLLPGLGARRTEKALEVLECCDRVRARMAEKTHCPQGHPYDEENTYINQGTKFCRTCGRAAVKRYLARKRENRLAAAL